MTEQDQKLMVDLIGKHAGAVGAALAVVVTALRQQPGFDNAGFDALLKKELATLGVGETTRSIYKMILGEPLE